MKNIIRLQILLQIGKNLGIESINEKNLSVLFKHLADIGFEPYSNNLTKSRHKNGYNYSLKFLDDLMEHTNTELRVRAASFKYNYSDNMLAQEFNIKRNILLYLKNSHIKSYQILCDAYSYRATKLKTDFAKMKILENANESKKIINKCLLAIYEGGSSNLGLSSIAKTLHELGIDGYKTHSSITKSFNANTARIRYIEDIINGYNLEWEIVSKSNNNKSKKEKDDLQSGDLETELQRIYETDLKSLKGLSLKSVENSQLNKEKVIKEAIAFRREIASNQKKSKN